MSKYIHQCVNQGEAIVLEARTSPVRKIILSILLLVLVAFSRYIFVGLILVLLLIRIGPDLLQLFFMDLAITSKRVIGKKGWIYTKKLDVPLNKVQSVKVTTNLLGRIFNYGTIRIFAGTDEFVFTDIISADDFKKTLMNTIEQFDEERIRHQAEQLAEAMKK